MAFFLVERLAVFFFAALFLVAFFLLEAFFLADRFVVVFFVFLATFFFVDRFAVFFFGERLGFFLVAFFLVAISAVPRRRAPCFLAIWLPGTPRQGNSHKTLETIVAKLGNTQSIAAIVDWKKPRCAHNSSRCSTQLESTC